MRMQLTRRYATPLLVTSLIAGASSLRASAQSGPAPASLDEVTDGFGPAVKADVAKLRAATDAFHDLTKAQAAGYPTTTPNCVADSTMGGMGRHYLDRTIYDDKLEIEHPEMLIYAPAADGKYQLVGVEYVVPFRLVPDSATAPRLFGQELRPHRQFKYWYLHVWAWTKNKAGLFADWNPAIKC
jgi:hypothetical protein